MIFSITIYYQTIYPRLLLDGKKNIILASIRKKKKSAYMNVDVQLYVLLQ